MLKARKGMENSSEQHVKGSGKSKGRERVNSKSWRSRLKIDALQAQPNIVHTRVEEVSTTMDASDSDTKGSQQHESSPCMEALILPVFANMHSSARSPAKMARSSPGKSGSPDH